VSGADAVKHPVFRFGDRARLSSSAMARKALCPRCTDRLKPWAFDGAHMEACGRCGGALLTPAALATALGPHVRPESWTERGLAHLEGPSPLRCPAHGRSEPAMQCFVIRHEDAEVEVDVCTECAAIWLDAGEGAELRAMVDAVHAAERASLPPEVAAGELDVFDAAVKSDDRLAGQVAAGTTRRRAWVTIALALICVVVFVLFGDDAMARWLAYVPAELWRGERLYGLLTHMVAHAGIGHTVGNVFFLLILGPSLERHLGPWLFAGLFVAAGVGSFLVHAMFTTTPGVPVLGASGAVAGLVGAVLVEAPRRRLVIGSSKAPTVFQTVLIAAGWLVAEVVIPAFADPSIAWLGHLGGFVTGGVVLLGYRALDLPRPVKPSARTPRPTGGFRRALDRATSWISEKPAISIPLLGVGFIAVVLLSTAYSEHRECDAARSRAADALRAYADRAESLPPRSDGRIELFPPPTPAEARAKANAIEGGADVPSSVLVGSSHDAQADRLLTEAESWLWQLEFHCRE